MMKLFTVNIKPKLEVTFRKLRNKKTKSKNNYDNQKKKKPPKIQLEQAGL